MTARVALIRWEWTSGGQPPRLAQLVTDGEEEFVAFVSSRCVAPAGWPEMLIETIGDDESIVACGGPVMLFADDSYGEKAARFLRLAPFLAWNLIPEADAKRSHPRDGMALENAAIRRASLADALARKPYLDARDGVELCALLRQAGGRVWFDPRAAVNRRAPLNARELTALLKEESHNQKMSGRHFGTRRPAQVLAVYFVTALTLIFLTLFWSPALALALAAVAAAGTWAYFFVRSGRAAESLWHAAWFLRAMWMNIKE